MESRTRIAIAGMAAAAGLLAAGAALAHHSYSMFDSAKEMRLVGTVKEYQWTNPHVFVQIVADGPEAVEWSVEGAGLNTLIRQGWTRNSVKAGEKVSATIHPMRDGSKGGSLIRLYMPDGRVLGEPVAPAR